MKKKCVYLSVIAVMLISVLAFLSLSCDKDDDANLVNNDMSLRNANSNLSVSCGEETEFVLWAGQTINAGNLIVSNDDEYLYVTYLSSEEWLISELNLYVLKVAPDQRLNPGNAPFKKLFSDPVNGFIFEIELACLGFELECDNSTLWLQAKADLIFNDPNSEIFQSEGAFAGNEGEILFNSGWFYNINYQLKCCVEAPDCPAIFTDSRDGNTYPIVQIGDQCWMAENLKYLPEVQNLSEFYNGWSVNSETPLYAVMGYDDSPSNVQDAKESEKYKTYGVLYNWHSAMISCPAGWHLPTQEEWQTLIDYLGGNIVAGGKLKLEGTDYWLAPNTGATNESGFSALPGSRVYSDSDKSSFQQDWLGVWGLWWSASESELGPGFAPSIQLTYIFERVDILPLLMDKDAISVRCIKTE